MDEESCSLHLNRTHLLFIPLLPLLNRAAQHPGPDSSMEQGLTGIVVQVSLRAERFSDQDEHTYALEEATITRIIETLVAGHVNAVPKLPECIFLRHVMPGYDLVGVKKPWKYGRGKQFFLGDVALQPAEDKWIFRFQVAK